MTSHRDGTPAPEPDPETPGPEKPDLDKPGGTAAPAGEADPVKVVLRLVDDGDNPGAETFWATPLDVKAGSGTFRVQNALWYAPVVPGDVVRCGLDGDSRYQVVELVEPQAVYLAAVLLPEADDDAAATDQAREIADQVRAAGANLEFAVPRVLHAYSSDASIIALLEELEQRGIVEDWDLLRTPDEAVDLSALDTELQSEPTIAPHTTTYWAPDDPFWAANGFADPDFLAYVQNLAGQDPRVARALERGRHDQVLTYLHRIAVISAGERPEPLDGPLFGD